MAPRAARLPVAATAVWAGVRLAYRVGHPPRPDRRRRHPHGQNGVRELRIPARPGPHHLHAWLWPGDPARVVVVGHAIGGEKAQTLPVVRFLAAAGYTVVAFDFRNHGRSFTDRALTGYSHRFAADVRRVVAHVRARSEHAGARVALYGMSMSAYAVMHAVGRLSGVAGLVCDGGPTTDPTRTAVNLLRSGALEVPDGLSDGPAARLLHLVFGRLVAATMTVPRPWPPPPAAPRYAGLPMLFLVGARDEVVRAAEVRSLAAGYARAEVVEIPQAGHLHAMRRAPRRYRDAVLAFLDLHLGTPRTEPPCGSP